MEDPIPSSISHKRPLEDEIEDNAMPSTNTGDSRASTPLSVISHMQTPSPMKSTPQNTTISNGAISTSISQPTSASDASAQPAKRRKLTQKEKDDQRFEKEAKAKAREEKKAQKAAEDKIKAEQKAQKDEEKRKKLEEQDEKKRLKEEKQQQKKEEEAKKERSQMRLGAFFVKPKVTETSSGLDVVDSNHSSQAPSTFLATDTPIVYANLVSSSPQKSLVKKAQSDYERYFFPFNVATSVIMAPKNAFLPNPDQLLAAQARLDDVMKQEHSATDLNPIKALKTTFSSTEGRGLETLSIAELVDRVNGSAHRPINLTDDTHHTSDKLLLMLKSIPMKYLHFGEDVRPPYYGTYTKSYTGIEARRLARNPFSRTRKDTNYDYDSEAEWDEPEEGEDINSDGEEDLDEEAEDDMEDFLDDEDDAQAKRRLISGDLVPICTGLCWEDTSKVSKLNDGSGAICSELSDFKMGFLLENKPASIDPFSTAYWLNEPAATTPFILASAKDPSKTGGMNPPRAPLSQRTMNGLLNTLNTPQSGPSSTGLKPSKPKRMIPAEHMPAFKAEVEGKDLTKLGMIEALKKVFPKIPKDAIANTLSVVAARVGPTEKEKRWVVINT